MDIFERLDESVENSQRRYFVDTPVEDINVAHLRPDQNSVDEMKLVDRIFRHYRREGFPYPTLTLPEIKKRFRSLLKSNSELKKGHFEMSTTGIAICNAFHSEQMYRVKCHNYYTALDVFESDRMFRRAVLKWVRHGDCVLSQGVLKYLRTAPTTQTVSNFRPAVAKAIYEIFNPRLTLDFSAGWGARLLGAMAAGVPYIGIDPNTVTTSDNRRLLATLRGLFPHMHFDVMLGAACAEDFLGHQQFENLDLIFTSPPYFNTEKYCDQKTQSYLRYPTRESWYDKFLRVCIEGAFLDLADGGHLVLNVNPDMGSHTLEYAKRAGFVLEDTWQLNMTQRQYNKKHHRKEGKREVRHEPIFIFRKGDPKIRLDAPVVDLLGPEGMD
jgi:hypothetical protein